MQCPNCSVDLVMSDRQGVEIDYCPKCRGVWLDRGELDKIIERSAAYEERLEGRRDDRGRGDDYRRDAQYAKPKKKKKSFLSEFLEFD